MACILEPTCLSEWVQQIHCGWIQVGKMSPRNGCPKGTSRIDARSRTAGPEIATEAIDVAKFQLLVPQLPALLPDAAKPGPYLARGILFLGAHYSDNAWPLRAEYRPHTVRRLRISSIIASLISSQARQAGRNRQLTSAGRT